MILKINKIMDIYTDQTKDELKDLPTKEQLFCNIVKTMTPICENTLKNQQFTKSCVEEKPQNNETFIVSALRHNHSYNVAVFTDVDLAIKCANEHKIYRGGKYECVVEKFINNKYDEESAIENNEIIYKTF